MRGRVSAIQICVSDSSALLFGPTLQTSSFLPSVPHAEESSRITYLRRRRVSPIQVCVSGSSALLFGRYCVDLLFPAFSTERVGSGLWWRKLFDFLSRNDSESYPYKKNIQIKRNFNLHSGREFLHSTARVS